VVFDLGGVLIDWNPRYLYRQLFTDHSEMERFLAEVCTDAWHRQHDLGADILESCQRLAARLPRLPRDGGRPGCRSGTARRCASPAAAR
jgi:2-haloacid dehalogenase